MSDPSAETSSAQEQVAVALVGARTAAAAWGAVPLAERRTHLRLVRKKLAARGEDIAKVLSAETGKPLVDALMEVVSGLNMLDWVARNAARSLATRRVGTAPLLFKRAWVEYDPQGVIGVIAPFNYPVGIAMQSLPWVFGAGNVALLKPSEFTPLTLTALAGAINSAGHALVHVVQGGGEVGSALAGADVGTLVFTGSVATGRRVMVAAASRLTPVVMELGGKDAMLVLDDADLDKAARVAAGAGFSNGGQTCMAPERILVADAVYDDFLSRMLTVTKSLTVGSGPRDHVGPVVDARALDRAEERLAAAVAAGARVVAGGHRLSDLGPLFFAPTVVVDVHPDSALLTEESFAPVVSVLRVNGDDEAIQVANNSDLALSASVFSRDPKRARRVASRLVTGGVVINDALVGAAVAGLPFGGERASGVGRLQGEEGLRQLSRQRSVIADRRGTPAFSAWAFTGRRPSPTLLRKAMKVMSSTGG